MKIKRKPRKKRVQLRNVARGKQRNTKRTCVLLKKKYEKK